MPFGLNGNVQEPQKPPKNTKAPVGSYNVPFFVYPILVLGIYNHKFGHPKKTTWYEPTGMPRKSLVIEMVVPFGVPRGSSDVVLFWTCDGFLR